MLVADDQNLVATAVEWITQNPGVPMPTIAAWSQFFADDSSVKSITLRNSMDRAKVDCVTPRIVPFLVAVNLGLPLDEIASIIKHHGIKTCNLDGLRFNSTSGINFIKGKPATNIEDFHLAFYKACDLDPELLDRIEYGIANCKQSVDTRIALLQTGKPKAWLASWLDDEQSSEKLAAFDWVRSMPTDFNLTDPKFWPDGSFGKLLERCGAFHKDILLGDPTLLSNGKQGFWSQLIYESTFTLRNDETREFWALVADQLGTEHSDSIVRGLRTLERRDTSKTDFEALDSLTKAAAVNGTWERIPTELMVAAAVSKQDIGDFGRRYLDYSDSGIFEEIAESERVFFKKASGQFMAIPFEELGWSELRAIWNIPRMNMPAQDFSGVDCEALMTRVLKASDALPGIDEHRVTVINSQIQLVSYLAGSLTLSPEYLKGLNQNDLEAFVRGGVAPEMRGELSYTAKARTFRDELGL